MHNMFVCILVTTDVEHGWSHAYHTHIYSAHMVLTAINGLWLSRWHVSHSTTVSMLAIEKQLVPATTTFTDDQTLSRAL